MSNGPATSPAPARQPDMSRTGRNDDDEEEEVGDDDNSDNDGW